MENSIFTHKEFHLYFHTKNVVDTGKFIHSIYFMLYGKNFMENFQKDH